MNKHCSFLSGVVFNWVLKGSRIVLLVALSLRNAFSSTCTFQLSQWDSNTKPIMTWSFVSSLIVLFMLVVSNQFVIKIIAIMVYVGIMTLTWKLLEVKKTCLLMPSSFLLQEISEIQHEKFHTDTEALWRSISVSKWL